MTARHISSPCPLREPNRSPHAPCRSLDMTPSYAYHWDSRAMLTSAPDRAAASLRRPHEGGEEAGSNMSGHHNARCQPVTNRTAHAPPLR